MEASSEFKWEDAKIEDYPYNAYMRNNKGIVGDNVCTGSIISEKHILSTTACISFNFPGNNEKKFDFQVYTGTHNTESGGEAHRVKNVWLHENFKYDTQNNNIAVVEVLI